MAHFILKNNGRGFFGNFTAVLLRLYDLKPEDTLAVHWRTTGTARETGGFTFAYGTDAGENSWLHYFEPLDMVGEGEPIILSPSQGISTRMIPGECYSRRRWQLFLGSHEWRHEFHALYHKWIRVRPRVADRVENFYQEHMANRHCVGIHYRCPHGHIQEEPGGVFPTVAEFIQAAEKLAAAETRFFLATDDGLALQEFQAHFGARLCLQSVRRWQGEEDELHVRIANDKQNGPDLGDEILTDALLLARCDAMVHTSSSVAAAVAFMNPELRLCYIGGTDADIVERRRAIHEEGETETKRRALQAARQKLAEIRLAAARPTIA